METAVSLWPSPQNRAIVGLEEFYRDEGDTDALKALKERVKGFKAR
jgi:hypothetical protein